MKPGAIPCVISYCQEETMPLFLILICPFSPSPITSVSLSCIIVGLTMAAHCHNSEITALSLRCLQTLSQQCTLPLLTLLMVSLCKDLKVLDSYRHTIQHKVIYLLWKVLQQTRLELGLLPGTLKAAE